jgi:hypothetical protein
MLTAMRRDDILLRGELGVATVSPRVRQRVLDDAAGVRRGGDWRTVLALAAALILAAIGVPFIAGTMNQNAATPSPVAVVPSSSPSPSASPTGSPSPSPSPSLSTSPSLAPSVSVPPGPGSFVNGNYAYTNRTDSIAARLVDGRPVGEWWRRIGEQSYSGRITCLVIQGNKAWAAGRTTNMPAGTEERAMYFHLVDGGPSGDGDLAIGILSNPGQPLGTMDSWCETRFVASDPNQIIAGDIVVDDSGG